MCGCVSAEKHLHFLSSVKVHEETFFFALHKEHFMSFYGFVEKKIMFVHIQNQKHAIQRNSLTNNIYTSRRTTRNLYEV